MQFRRGKKDIAASLEYISEDGQGINVFRPALNIFKSLIGIGPPVEESWQKELRHYDLNHVGIFGNSLDIIAFTAAAASLEYVDPTNLAPIPDAILQEKILQPVWRGDKDIFEMLFVLVRSLGQVGEIDLVCINGEYDLFQISQRVKDTKNKYDKQGNLLAYGTVTYRQRDTDEHDLVTISKQHIERCFVPQPGANHEAYAPGRRVLPWMRLYAQIVTQFQRIAFSNSLMTKGVYLGEDDRTWEQNEEYLSQFSNPNQAVPPIVNDMAKMAQEISKGGKLAPWWPMMGPEKPIAIDLTTSFDEQARQVIKDCDREIALGLNIPSRLLLGDNVNHFAEWLQDEQFRTYAVAPLLKIAIKFLDKHIYSKYPTKYGYAAKLWYSFDELTANSLNPAQFIELFKIGVVGSQGIQRHLKLSAQDAYLSPQDIQLRRELLTGDSGLQQAQLAQRYGQQANAVGPNNPLTNGQLRQNQNALPSQEEPIQAPQVTAALEDDKIKKKS